MITTKPIVVVLEGLPSSGLSSIITNLRESLRSVEVPLNNGKKKRLLIATAFPYSNVVKAISNSGYHPASMSKTQRSQVVYALIKDRMNKLLQEKRADVILVERFMATYYARWLKLREGIAPIEDFAATSKLLSNHYNTWYIKSSLEYTKELLKRSNSTNTVYDRRPGSWISNYKSSLDDFFASDAYVNKENLSVFDLDKLKSNITVYNSNNSAIDAMATFENLDSYLLEVFKATFINDNSSLQS